MEISAANTYNKFLDGQEMAKLTQDVNSFNKVLADSKVKTSQNLDKDDFLKILMVQLSHQDPTDPMKDRDFIAQMAQFSSLEQMTNMSKNFGDLTSLFTAGQASQMLGKDVEIAQGTETVQGKVTEVTTGKYPQVFVDGRFYDFSQITKVKEMED